MSLLSRQCGSLNVCYRDSYIYIYIYIYINPVKQQFGGFITSDDRKSRWPQQQLGNWKSPEGSLENRGVNQENLCPGDKSQDLPVTYWHVASSAARKVYRDPLRYA
jgi:hypothetical protein